MAVFEALQLHITSEKFIIQPSDPSVSELLVIDRVSQDISLLPNQGQVPAAAITKPICGILGILRLVAGPYLIVITKRKKVGEIQGHAIWKVAGTEVHSYKRTNLHLTEQQIADNKNYLMMLDHVLKTEAYYFSYTHDLTHTLQRIHNTSPDFSSLALHERADQRFVWNGHVLRELAQQPELGSYCLPVVHGFISISTCNLNSRTFDYILVSRRSVYRAGTRFYVRGLDSEGQAANFVETEQIVQYNGFICSFVQTRGSIPLYWSQFPDLRRMPLPAISNKYNHLDGFKKHFNSQIYNYGKQVIVNLVNQKGYEHLMEKALAQTVITCQNPNIRYEAFDFHKECSKMRWDRLSLLTDKLEAERREFGYFMMQQDGKALSSQSGVFRTNCMDCLDRTNVVQSLLAKEALLDQMQKLGVLSDGEKISPQSPFDSVFKNVWADNADYLSVQYAGTGALKTDFTRTGKRSIQGALMDGYNSAIRYFKNNFYDGFRQDAVDLFLGNYLVEENEGITKLSPLRVHRDWKFYALPVIFLVCMAMTIISILIPDEHKSEEILYVLFWGGFAVAAVVFMYMSGKVFVDQPRLAQSLHLD